jgi:hypothetical protein
MEVFESVEDLKREEFDHVLLELSFSSPGVGLVERKVGSRGDMR